MGKFRKGDRLYTSNFGFATVITGVLAKQRDPFYFDGYNLRIDPDSTPAGKEGFADPRSALKLTPQLEKSLKDIQEVDCRLLSFAVDKLRAGASDFDVGHMLHSAGKAFGI